jgi:CopG family nickel-responsive transcriptional regulator
VQRFTISLEDDLAQEFTRWIARHKYQNRSEAVRDLLRRRLTEESLEQAEMPHCVGTVVYVYDHHETELGRRLTRHQHQQHDLTVSTLHVHLDEKECLEVCVLRGPGAAVKAQAERLIAERSVHNGSIHLIPASPVHRHDPAHP